MEIFFHFENKNMIIWDLLKGHVCPNKFSKWKFIFKMEDFHIAFETTRGKRKMLKTNQGLHLGIIYQE